VRRGSDAWFNRRCRDGFFMEPICPGLERPG